MEANTLRPTVMDIDLDALKHNFEQIKLHVRNSAVMPILKANAYGHGLTTCAKQLASWGAEYFGVAFVEEGIALRQAGIKIPILALGGVAGRQVESFLEYDIDLTASSVMKLDSIDQIAKRLNKKARVHLKVDTGMERIGVHYYSAKPFLEKALNCQHCQVVGLFSHFANAEEQDLSFARLQLKRFQEVTEVARSIGLKPELLHMANSGALIELPESHLSLVRPGLALYGIAPAKHLADRLNLRPVASLTSEVVYFKVIPANVGVSYNLTWHSRQQTRIVTVACGYGDGFPRSLSNSGEVLIRGQRYPIVGRICMDQFMVDLGQGQAFNGDQVVLIGRQGDQEISAESVAQLAQTDIRDVLLSINARVPRRYLYQGEIVLKDDCATA